MSAPKSASTVATGTPAAALPVDLNQLERLAQPAMSPMAWDYVRGGAADEITLRENRAAYDRIRLKPRVLCDVSRIDTAAVLLSQPLACPILLAPAAYHRLYHPDGEI